MASGTLGEIKHRWGEGNPKVYTRKFQRGLKSTGANDNNLSNDASGGAATNNNARDDADAAVVNVARGNDKSDGENEKEKDNVSNVAQQSSQTLATEEANSSPRQETPSRVDAPASVDSSSLNRPVQSSLPNGKEQLTGGNGSVKPVITRIDDRVKINLGAGRSKNELDELRQKLLTELDQVRTMHDKLKAKEAQLTNYSAPAAPVVPTGGGGRYSQSLYSTSDVRERSRELVRVNSDVGSVRHHKPRLFRQLTVAVMNNNHGVSEIIEKEKRTPKANQFYRNSEFLLGKDRLPPESNKKSKTNGGKKHKAHGFGSDKNSKQMFRSCSNLLQRLMGHKHGWVFNEPVDAKALGLRDYHDIIKYPMDFGTIKSRLAQNWYKSPREFAEDVRLTFRNAMTYNPKGQDVHVMAEQLSEIFEDRWAVIETEYNSDWRYEMYQMRTLERSESMTTPVGPKHKPSRFVPASTGSIRTPAPKKPKANDPDKRDMTYEEKQRLSTNLQGLPPEKLDAIVQIIKKRNSTVSQHDDEIEVDIDSVDAETLWELDRFVTNHKKSLSKIKRKAELAKARAEAAHAIPSNAVSAPATMEVSKQPKIDERNAATAFPDPREKQGDNASSSSSSSSGSSSDSDSSSSDSDSDSSSAKGSDAGHSPRT